MWFPTRHVAREPDGIPEPSALEKALVESPGKRPSGSVLDGPSGRDHRANTRLDEALGQTGRQPRIRPGRPRLTHRAEIAAVEEHQLRNHRKPRDLCRRDEEAVADDDAALHRIRIEHPVRREMENAV